jgi:hypothetical protein
VRQGASWTAASHRQLTVAAVARPVRRGVGALGVLAAARSWWLPAQTASARSSVQPVSSGRASWPWSTPPAATPRRRSPVSSMRCPPIRCRRPGSGCPAVRCPVARGRRPEGSGARPSGIHPCGVQPSGVHPSGVQPSAVCPSVRTRPSPPMLRRWCWDPGRGGRATLTTGIGGGPGGWRAVGRLDDGRGGRDAAEVAWSGGGRWRARAAGLGAGGGGRACPLRDQAGQAGRAERSSRAAALWARVQAARRAREQAAMRGGGTRHLAGVIGLGGRPRCVVVAEPDTRVGGGPGGTTGGAGGDGRAAPARPKPAASAPGSLLAAL